MAQEKRIDLTEGPIGKQLLRFVWPIIIANVFQQIYNITNSLIVGNYIDTEALSAVSATNSITIITQYFYFGFSTATSILVANYYGAGRKDKVKKAIETAFMVGITVGILFFGLLELCTPLLMRISNIDASIYQNAERYLRVYVIGDTPMMIYNICFFIMRSMGDSRTPTRYLIVSCLINLVLGIVFVGFMHMGVIGVALATTIAQLIIAVMAVIRVLHLDEEIKIDLLHMQPDTSMIRSMFTLGIPAAFQNILIALSEFTVQSYINMFSNEFIAGIGVASKVSLWVHMPMHAVSTVATSYVGQNLGAGKYERVKEGIRFCLRFAMAMTVVLAAIFFVFAPFMVSLFDRNPEVIRYGSIQTRLNVLSYIPLTWSHIYNGCCRGAGNVKAPMIIAVFSQCIVRFIFVTVGLKLYFSEIILYLSAPLAWSLAGVLALIYFHASKYTKEAQLR
ncbi:MAG: MATE family efflux transporter [Erysipelotrichaceae bacterium]|nr:MATE family efflux transporter [Erysipelotrichaceae bacterium]